MCGSEKGFWWLSKILRPLSIYDKVNFDMPKRTHQPKTRHRARKHGFRHRMATKAGRLVLKARRLKQRAKLSI